MNVTIGARAPRRGNAFSRGLGYWLLRLMGWRIEGAIPDLPKMVIIGAPHTSNRDGILGITGLIALGLDAATMIKDSAFRGPLGGFLRWAGAIPIHRAQARGVVEQSIDAFRRRETLALLIAPEGTRKAAPEWRRGFHHIARAAGVPIVPAAINYRSKRIVLGPPLTPTAHLEADLEQLWSFFVTVGYPAHAGRLSQPLAHRMGIRWQGNRDTPS